MIKESELDADQIRVLQATLDKSCVISGCAGSGKSVLALIKAQRIQKERGNNYEIIVYTKALCRYMNSGREMLGLTKPFYYHWRWKNDLNCPSADYVIVDEIQDFEEDEIKEFIDAAKKHFFFYGDTAQSIYEGLKDTMAVEDIGDLFDRGNKPKFWELYRNYRLPVPMAKFVQYVGIDLPSFDENVYKSEEKDKPFVLKYPDRKEQASAIKRIISEKELTDVAILLPHNDMVKVFGEMLIKEGVNCELRFNDKSDWKKSIDRLNFESTNPKVMTYHSAKGLQFETVFLPLLEEYEENWNFSKEVDENRKPLYVAMTRTYKDLYVMYSGEFPDVLSTIPSELYVRQETEEIDDI